MTMEINYFRKYNLNKEPFSSSPDPDFLYQSRQHFGVMQQLENAIRYKSGVNLVTGIQGTGKTTLLRHLYRKISKEKNLDVHLLNAEFCESQAEFEQQIIQVFGYFEKDPFVHTLHPDMHFHRLLDTIRENPKHVVLLIDNGHLISKEGLKVLLRLADLEQDGEGKVQVLIFANHGIMDNINGFSEFKSKIRQYNVLGPMSFTDTRHMIHHRLKVAGNSIKQTPLFTYPALLAIYIATGGYPKKIVKLCHRLILSMSIKKSMKAGWFQVRFCARKVLSKGSLFPDVVFTSFLFVLISIGVFVFLNSFGPMTIARMDDQTTIAVHSEGAKVESSDLADETGREIAVAKNTVSIKPNQNVLIQADVIEEQVKTPSLPDVLEKGNPAMVESTEDHPVDPFTENLGIVEVKRGDTLLEMLEIVYGHSRSIYRDYAFKANEHFADLNNLSIGDRVIFPAINAPVTPSGGDTFWVRLSSFPTLEQAFDFVRAWPSEAPRIKMIPFFREDSGLHVDVVLKRLFPDSVTAQNAMNGLLPYTAKNMDVIQFDLKDSHYYSDPYFK